MTQPSDVVVVEAVRTPIGRGHPDKGVFRNLHPHDLLGAVYTAVLDRAGVDPLEVGQVLTGCVQQIGEQGANVARNAWLHAGLPVEVPASTVDTQCGASQQAVNLAAALIASGAQDVVIAAGVEHMGHLPFAAGVRVQVEYGDAITPQIMGRHGLIKAHNLVGQGLSAERIATTWGLSRARLEEWALRSHQRADAATRAGAFAREILPVKAGGKVHNTDQGIRPDTTAESLAALPPVFADNGRLTAGTSSQTSDGASAVLLMSAARARALGVRARARVRDHALQGDDPLMMLTAPIPLTRRMLQRNRMVIEDLDIIEINEAFASVVGAWLAELRPDPERVNPRGGAIALGHPLGASGARLITTLLHEMEDLDAELGFLTMCCAGGLATGTLIERI
ncbi:thiolase family protein [Streptomyces sp. NA02950]|uniref:thiolase family protein n=1 Tax=Streptomyces sp. NA02950 TaxID=2742137 RepID=UPI001591907A|nr:thiolase family protein [Streptomyces sp. NA02950]QKV96000.1 thiolase family protein [Streptomyces sp. NA02950]